MVILKSQGHKVTKSQAAKDKLKKTCPLYGLILSGGKSKRMGRDKGLIRINGKPQIENCYNLLSGFCDKVFISCRTDQTNSRVRRNFPQIVDNNAFACEPRYTSHEPLSCEGPLTGILSAMHEYPKAAWLVLAVDLICLDKKTIADLIKKRDRKKLATAFRNPDNKLPEPLCAIYEPRFRPRLLKFLKQGILCPRKIMLNSEIKSLTLSRKDALNNMNRAEDLQ